MDITSVIFTVLLGYYNQGNNRLPKQKDSFERWVELACTNNQILNNYSINVTINSGSSGGASVGGGSFPDFIAKYRGRDIFFECKSVKGNPAEIQENSTIPSGKYRNSSNTIVDVHYLYCEYEPKNNAIGRLAVINGDYYGDNPNLIDLISDFIFNAIQDKIASSGSTWSVSRGARGAIYIEDIGHFKGQHLRCRVRQMYHSRNPFRTHNPDFFCVTTKTNWNIFKKSQQFMGLNYKERPLQVIRQSTDLPFDFVVLTP